MTARPPLRVVISVIFLTVGCASGRQRGARDASDVPRIVVGSAGAASTAAVREMPLARRVCDALHALPAMRKKECCPAAPDATLTDLCTAELSASLQRGAVVVEPASVDRCAAALAARLEGCDWVRPVLPALPPECSAL